MRLSLILVLLFLLIGCRSTIEATSVDDDPRYDLRGRVLVEPPNDSVTPNHAGVNVTLVGTSYTTTSDSNGSYRFEQLPQGLYTVLLTTPGHDTGVVNSVAVLPPSGATAETRLLSVPDSVTIALDSITITGPNIRVAISLESSTWDRGVRPALRLLFGHTPDVNPRYIGHTLQIASRSQTAWIGDIHYFTVLRLDQLRYPEIPYGKPAFKSGDSVYLVAYNTGEEDRPERLSFVEPDSHNVRWINLRNRSNVIAFVMP